VYKHEGAQNMKSAKLAISMPLPTTCQQCVSAIANPATTIEAMRVLITRSTTCMNTCQLRRQLKELAGAPSARHRATS